MNFPATRAVRLHLLYLAFISLPAVASGTPTPVFSQPLFAGQLSEKNLSLLPEGGLDAIGGRGDWLLTDGYLCAVVSSREHPTYLSLRGGVLVDLWHCDRANDQWSTKHQQYNLQKEEIPETRLITAGYDDHQSWIETHAVLEGLKTVTRYLLDRNSPGQLAVNTRVTRIAGGAPLQMYGTTILHPRGSLTPFTLDTLDGEYSTGFDQPAIDTADRSSILSAVGGQDLQILLGSRHIQPSISYGVKMVSAKRRDRDGGERPLQTFMMGGQFFSIFAAFSQPFPEWWTRAPGIFSFLIGQLFDLDLGESLDFRQIILLGVRADAASITDRLYLGPIMRGQLDTHDAGITVRDNRGRSLTFARPQGNGRFSFRLPAETKAVELTVRTPWGNTTRLVETTGRVTELGGISTRGRGTVTLPRGEPVSLVFRAAGEDPVFYSEVTGSRVGGERVMTGPETHRINLSGSEQDLRDIQLAPGSYRVIATRGPEYSVTETNIVVTAGESVDLDIAHPTRAVNSEGLVSADFHVHSGVSFDSSLHPEQRISDFVAQGCEVLVPTEHHIIHDLQPVIESMGLQAHVVSFPGVELTGMIRTAQAPTTIGHSNVFPVAVDDQGFMGGTLPFEGKRLGQVIASYKEQFPGSIFQLNHPRDAAYEDDLAFFNHLSVGRSFDPGKSLLDATNNSLLEEHPDTRYRDIDFDAMELLSGEAMDGYEVVRTDWFALLKQNVYKIATANSDSHASQQIVAFPRSMLGIEADDPAMLKTSDIVAAITSGHVYGTTGPILRVRLGDTAPGGVYPGPAGTLKVSADSADWVNIEEIRIWVNGELWKTLPGGPGKVHEIELVVETDSFVFVEVSGSASDLYKIVAPGFQPFAFANPVFIDIHDDGWKYGSN